MLILIEVYAFQLLRKVQYWTADEELMNEAPVDLKEKKNRRLANALPRCRDSFTLPWMIKI